MSVQTRFSTQLNGAITDIQTTVTLDAAPAFTTGFGTFERGAANEEDFYWGNVSGLQLTNLLRGLSKTALTVTEVVGNKKAHDDNKTMEATLLHYIINNKADLDENEAITGAWTFNTSLPSSTINPTGNDHLVRKGHLDTQLALKGNLAGGNTWSGTQIFPDNGAESTTSAAPSSDKKFANKKYVDDQIAALADFPQPLATAISDVSTSSDEIDQALDGISANVTAVNLSALVGGGVTALHSHANLATTVTAGENIDGSTTPKAAFISRGTTSSDAFPLQIQETENDTDIDVYGVNFSAQTFTTTTFQTKVTRIDLLLMDVSDAPGDFQIDIYAVDGSSKPTGASLATKTVTATNIVNTYLDWETFTLDSALTVTPNTEYAIVAKALGADAANYIEWQTGNGNTYSGGQAWRSTDAGSTWASQTDDFAFRVWGYEEQTAGRLYMSDSNEPFRGMVDGFVTSNTAAGAAATFVRRGRLGTFAGLTAGAPYFVSTTIGGIATSGGLKVGSAYSTTEIDIDFAGGFVEKSVVTSPTLSQAVTTPELYLAQFSVGFKPSRVELEIKLDALAGTDNQRLVFKGQYTSSLSGITVKIPDAATDAGAVGLVSQATSVTVTDAGGIITTTAGTFLLTNNGLVFTISMNDIASSTSASGSAQAVFYR